MSGFWKGTLNSSKDVLWRGGGNPAIRDLKIEFALCIKRETGYSSFVSCKRRIHFPMALYEITQDRAVGSVYNECHKDESEALQAYSPSDVNHITNMKCIEICRVDICTGNTRTLSAVVCIFAHS